MNVQRADSCARKRRRGWRSTIAGVMCGLILVTCVAPPAHAETAYELHMINNGAGHILKFTRTAETCMKVAGEEPTVEPGETEVITVRDDNNFFDSCDSQEKNVSWRVAVGNQPAPDPDGFGMTWRIYSPPFEQWYYKVDGLDGQPVPATAVRCGKDDSAHDCMRREQWVDRDLDQGSYFHFDFVGINPQPAGRSMVGGSATFSGIGAQGYMVDLHQGSATGPPVPGCQQLLVDDSGTNVKGATTTGGAWSCSSTGLPVGVSLVVAVQNDGIVSSAQTTYTVLSPASSAIPETSDTAQAELPITGKATPGAIVTATLSSKPTDAPVMQACTATTSSDGSWSCPSYDTATPGSYRWRIDQSVNDREADPVFSSTRVTLAIPVSIDTPAKDGDVIPEWAPQAQINGRGNLGLYVTTHIVNSAGALLPYTSPSCVNGATTVNDNDQWGCSFVPRGHAGTWQATAMEYRTDGSVLGTSATRTFTIAPTAPITMGAPTGTLMTGTAAPGATVTVTDVTNPDAPTCTTTTAAGPDLTTPTPWSCDLPYRPTSGQTEFTAEQTLNGHTDPRIAR